VVGYDTASAIARAALATRRSVREVAREMTDLDDAELDKLLDPATMVGE
jgi:fumarate hydratase class II